MRALLLLSAGLLFAMFALGTAPSLADEVLPPGLPGTDVLERLGPEGRRKVIEAGREAQAARSAAEEAAQSAAAARRALAEGPGPNGTPTRLQLMAEAKATSEEAARTATEARRTIRHAEQVLQDALDGAQAVGDTAAPLEAPFEMPTKSTVLGITKHHNQPWCGNWLALDLDMKLAIVGQKGKRVGVSVTFYEVANGRPLRSAMRPYVDANNTVSVYSAAVAIPSDAGVFTSRLKIPYRAFPWPTKGPSYAVEARAMLMRLEANGSVTPLDVGKTQFTIQFERGCGVVPRDACAMGRADGWVRNLRFDWAKMWGSDLGIEPSKAGLPPPKGPGTKKQWFEWRRGGLGAGGSTPGTSGISGNVGSSTGSTARGGCSPCGGSR